MRTGRGFFDDFGYGSDVVLADVVVCCFPTDSEAEKYAKLIGDQGDRVAAGNNMAIMSAHSKGWTEQQAVDYFLANTAAPEGQARSEVRRYIVLPGQATSYKIGMLKIQELRRDAEAELGDDFDIRAFHDTILGGGAMPLAILERRVDEWVASVKAG